MSTDVLTTISTVFMSVTLPFLYRYEARHAEYSGDLPIHYKLTLDSGKDEESARIWTNSTDNIFVIEGAG